MSRPFDRAFASSVRPDGEYFSGSNVFAPGEASDKPVVLIVCNVSWFFVSHRLPIARSAVKEGFRVIVCAAFDESTAEIKDVGCEFIDWPVSRGSVNVIQEVRSILSLRKIIKRVEPDVLHLVTPKPVFYGGFIGRILNVRSMVLAISGQGVASSSDGGFLVSCINKIGVIAYKFILSHKNTSVIVQNRRDETYLRSCAGSNPVFISFFPGSGVDLDSFRPGEECNPPTVILAARMLWSKGVGDFVEASKRIKEQGIEARFLLAGGVDIDNPHCVPENVLAEWSAGGSVEWLGHVENNQMLMRSSAVVCLPTTYGEGTPKVLLEAAACGKAIVATDWPGCDEVVSHGVNGFLYTPKDIESLVSSLAVLLKNKSMRDQFGAAGREIACSRFSDEKVASGTLGIYHRMLSISGNLK